MKLRHTEFTELVRTICSEMGELRVSDVLEAVTSRPVLSSLMHRDRIRLSQGAEKYDIISVECGSLALQQNDTPRTIVDRTKRVRMWAVLLTILEINRRFGRRKIGHWRLVILRGEWLQVTVTNDCTVFVDSVFRFERIRARGAASGGGA
jgi:hypothetical protein